MTAIDPHDVVELRDRPVSVRIVELDQVDRMLCTEAAEVFPEYLVLKQARLDRVRRDAQRVSPAEDVRGARLPKEEELAKSCAWGLPKASQHLTQELRQAFRKLSLGSTSEPLAILPSRRPRWAPNLLQTLRPCCLVARP